MQPSRILVIAQDFPYPATSGSRQRLTAVLGALGAVGDIDLFSLSWSHRTDPYILPADTAVVRSRVVHYPGVYPQPDVSVAGRLRWLASHQPYELAGSNFAQVRREFASFRHGHYDLVWFSRLDTFALFGDDVSAPIVIDVDDLEDEKQRARLAATDYGDSLSGRLHRVAAGAQTAVNARRWKALQRRAASRADAVAVCSSLDAARLGVRNVLVLPNGYHAPHPPRGRESVSLHPTLMLQGVLFYPPNSDGARWLIREVLPLLQARLPNVRLRLVGAPDPLVSALHDPPTVVVTGQVPDMERELDQADLVVVPVRFGSGTRIKILEAFAHRIPVVATALGAEGLEVTPGEHLLVADDPAGFADACLQLLTDVEARRRIAAAAEQRFLERYQWSDIQSLVVDLVTRIRDGRSQVEHPMLDGSDDASGS